MAGTQTITRKQGAAMRMARDCGSMIAMEHPEIADLYEAGASQREIALEYNIPDRYSLTEDISARAVQAALYILIPEDRRRRLEAEHNSARGRRLYEEGKAAFSLTEEQREEAYNKGLGALTWEDRSRNGKASGTKGGSIGGPRSQELGVGIHGLSDEDRRKYGRLAAQAAWGVTPWPDEEKEYFLELCETHKHDSGPQRGRPRYRRIAKALNRKYHNKRTINSLREMGKKLRNRAKSCQQHPI